MRRFQTHSAFYSLTQHMASFVPIATATFTEFFHCQGEAEAPVLCVAKPVNTLVGNRILSLGQYSSLVLGAIFIQALVTAAFFTLISILAIRLFMVLLSADTLQICLAEYKHCPFFFKSPHCCFL